MSQSSSGGLENPFTAIIPLLGHAVLLLNKPWLLFLFPHTPMHRSTRCQVVAIHPTSLTHLQQLKDWRTHNQQRESALFPVEEEGSSQEVSRGRWELCDPTVATTISPLACVVCVCLRLPIACVWTAGVCLCLHLKQCEFREAKIAMAAELNSLFQKLFPLLHFGFHLRHHSL